MLKLAKILTAELMKAHTTGHISIMQKTDLQVGQRHLLESHVSGLF